MNRIIEGFVELLGKVTEVDSPRGVNALSVEPSKLRLVLSMKGPDLWCKTRPSTWCLRTRLSSRSKGEVSSP